MWEAIQSSQPWGGIGAGVAWFVTICLLLAGLIGCILPILPGHLILLIGALAHRVMFQENSGLHWWSFAILCVLMAVFQAFEMLSGAAGAKWFGGTRWGALGALVGSIGGLFFLPLGLLLGPLIGAIVGEIVFAKKHRQAAALSGVGSVIGTIAGMGFKIVIGLMMVTWFFLDVFLIGQ
jgi:uncharacterized protein YqgC (DUF456 family)